MSFKICLSLEVSVEVSLWMRSSIVLLQVLLRDEELSALLALVKLTALFSRQFEQVLISGKRFLFQSELLLEDCILRLLSFYCVANFRSLLVRLLVVQVKRLRQRFKIVLSVDQVLDTHLTKSEKFDEVGVT